MRSSDHLKIYIAGPMAGYPEHNFPAFQAAAVRLRSLGYDVVSPHEVKVEVENPKAQDYLCADIRELLKCNAICLLDGWEKSIGAKCEATIAITLGFYFIDLDGFNVGTPEYVTVTKGYPV